jgi:dynein light intermediate chain 1
MTSDAKSLFAAGGDANSSDKDSIWQQVLAQSAKKTQPLPSKTILLLGERNTGKSCLSARLRGQDVVEGSKGGGVALDYGYLDILLSEENDDLLDRVDIWTLEGELGFANMLDLAINENTAAKSLALIALDLSQPWALVETLEKWIKVLENHLEARSLKDEKSEGLGMPLLVVVNKSDATAALEKDYGYKDDHFTFIQQHLRRICLKHKAGLLYTSAKRDKNCDVLRGYVKHLLYGLEFDASPQLIEKDTVFVPAGWDSIEKIQIDFSSQSLTNDEEAPFVDVIRVPASVSRQSKTNYEAEILAEEDQTFLERQLKQIDKNPQLGSAQAAGPGALYSSPTKPPSTSVEGTAPSTPARSASRPSAGVTPLKAPSTPLATPTKAAAAAAAADGTPSRGGGKGGQNEHKVLSDFFNSLINKDPRAAAAAKRKPSSASSTSSPTSTASPSRKEAEKSITRLTAKRDN